MLLLYLLLLRMEVEVGLLSRTSRWLEFVQLDEMRCDVRVGLFFTIESCISTYGSFMLIVSYFMWRSNMLVKF